MLSFIKNLSPKTKFYLSSVFVSLGLFTNGFFGYGIFVLFFKVWHLVTNSDRLALLWVSLLGLVTIGQNVYNLISSIIIPNFRSYRDSDLERS